jgi:AI-2 transport protein TqsA
MLDPRRTNNIFLGLIAVILVLTVLRYTHALVLPFVVACFIAMMIQPLMRWLNRFVPRWVSLLILLFSISIGILIDSLFFLWNVQSIRAKIPSYTKRFNEMFQSAIDLGQKYNIQIWDQESTQKAVNWGIQFITSGVSSAFNLLGLIFLVVFVMIFLVLETPLFQRKLRLAFQSEWSEEVLETLTSISKQIQQYVLTKTFISLITAAVTYGVLLLFGVDFALLWAILTFLLNYIPNIGSIGAVIPPVLLSFIQFDGVGRGLGVLICLALLQVLMGNVLDPRLTGRSLNLSTLVVFLSMVFWGWMWGIMGMVLAVPLTVGLKIVCEHINSLKPVAIFLSGDLSVYEEKKLPEQPKTPSTADPN